jgi:hypothetical protein
MQRRFAGAALAAATVPEAQRLFDQGLVLVYGFNHGQAIRLFSARGGARSAA